MRLGCLAKEDEAVGQIVEDFSVNRRIGEQDADVGIAQQDGAGDLEGPDERRPLVIGKM